MADSKITALTAISTVDPAADPLVIVDVSDASMAASGTTKKATINQLLGASGTATLASATITGDLTVDTSTLKVDAVNNRVGIGTATPARPLDIVGSFQSSLGWVLTGTSAGLGALNRYIGGASTTDSWYYNALTGGSHMWSFGESLAMTLNSTGLGVGVASPATKLDVAGNARVQLAFFTGGSIPGLTNENPFAYRVPGGGLGLGAATETGTVSPIIFYTGQGGVERVRVKGSGQVRFFPLAADPSLAEAGDVYYNSTSNKLKCYNGTTWNDLF